MTIEPNPCDGGAMPAAGRGCAPAQASARGRSDSGTFRADSLEAICRIALATVLTPCKPDESKIPPTVTVSAPGPCTVAPKREAAVSRRRVQP